jgi:cell division protein FtsB
MPKVHQQSTDVLAERAMQPDEPPPAQQSSPRGQLITEPEPARRMIYGGTMPPPPPSASGGGLYTPPKNRKVAKRSFPTSKIIAYLLVSAVLIVLYISNIIAVNQLVSDIHKEEHALQKALNEQEILRARINQLSSLERIRKRAEEELGLRNAQDVPHWLNVDTEKIREIEESLKRR